ncbi:MAG: acetolactate decarboxylase [Solirubrobacterales bacterium]
MILDERLVRHLHVESLRHRDLHPEHEPHVLFQASTIGALLDGAFDGDVSFAELAEHGDLGLGTLNALDGEMIALDGRFYRADVDGLIDEIPSEERTPFAAVAWFEASLEHHLERPLAYDAMLAELDRLAADPEASCTLRIDGEFELIRARSVPRQLPPYRPLAEVVADQHVFELTGVRGTVVGFRFPDYARGLEAEGYHLHFIDAERERGGHVLECRPLDAVAAIDLSGELHVELPPGIELDSADLDDATTAALDAAEH